MKTNMRLKRCLITLFLIVSLSVSAYAALPEKLILGGEVVGIHLNAEGPMITQILKNSPAKRAGLEEGDVLLEYNGLPVASAEMLSEMLQNGKSFELTVLHKGKRAQFYLRPEKTSEKYTIGIHVRESVSGIGTITFIDPESGRFGALGHGVFDARSGKLLPISSGFLVRANVSDVHAGQKGDPGQLNGEFDVTKKIGFVEENTKCGVFGKLRKYSQNKTVAVSEKEQVHTGKAQIFCTVAGSEPKLYEAEIMRIDPLANNGRNLLIHITDPALLSQTGGIVQGMSGSPILQDGKLIGAVTHVLVNDPQKGYGIFIEKMWQR